MTDAITAARALNKLYQNAYGISMPEFRMHKLLYFVQKEYLSSHRDGLFADAFQGWRYGPVLPVIHEAYKSDPFQQDDKSSEELNPGELRIIEDIYHKYESFSDWKLNSLTQEEFSWLQARKGLQPEENGKKEISLSAIRMDILKDRINEVFEGNTK